MEIEKQLRINALAKKQKEEGLTPEEQEEQKQLRSEYLAEFRANLKQTLDHTVVQEPEGTKIPLNAFRKKES